MVQASVDLARAGFTSGVDIEVLKDLHVRYLTNPSLRPEPWNEALSWATSVQYGASSLLVPGTYEETWRAFDYLPDSLSRDKRAAPKIPDFIWEEALSLNPEAESQWFIGMRAYMAGHTEHAISAWEPLAQRGDSQAASNLVAVYLEMGDREAVRHWRRVAHRDEFYSGTLPFRELDYDPTEGTVSMGQSRNGEPIKVRLHHPGHGVRHAMIAGDPGVGKSNSLNIALLGALASRRYVLGLLDWSHEQKHFEHMYDVSQWFCGNDIRHSITLLQAIVRVLDFRIENGGYIDPTPEKPAILVAIEEAQNLFSKSAEAVTLALRILGDGKRGGISLYATIPDISLASFGGNEELRLAFADDANTAYLMGDAGLQMWRDLDALRSRS
ncbi:hypothetical protein OIE73_16245 [Streptomyces hirsutus]|uniref:Uncharacterized protein n=1 Tax=Streptomyces hirsutus TaxID=35620 RepID=A0ABZ1GML0_9ACTN|nr:hypothetical protein [Streptomyces hirsutus]WSD07160.1 hypothetical protein OIE73_16245 [Streptomyces hirsutus]